LRSYKKLAQQMKNEAAERGDCEALSARTPRTRRSAQSTPSSKGKALEEKPSFTTQPTKPIVIKDESDNENVKTETKAEPEQAIIIDDNDTDIESIDAEIRRDNEHTRTLLKIKSRARGREPTADGPNKRHKRRDSSDIPTTLPNLLAPERSFRIDSQSNGYTLPHTARSVYFSIPGPRRPTENMTERLGLTAYAEDENSETKTSLPPSSTIFQDSTPVDEV
jgi:hypothetical protein